MSTFKKHLKQANTPQKLFMRHQNMVAESIPSVNDSKNFSHPNLHLIERQTTAERIGSTNGNRIAQNLMKSNYILCSSTSDNMATPSIKNSEKPKLISTDTMDHIQRDEEKDIDRTEAIKALTEWQQSHIQFLDATQRWLSNNWTHFISMTSTDPSLGLSSNEIKMLARNDLSIKTGIPEHLFSIDNSTSDSSMGFVHNVASNAFGNALSKVPGETSEDAAKYAAKSLVKAGFSSSGAVVGTLTIPVPVIGTVIGYAVGIIIESAASEIYDALLTSGGWGSEDTAMAEGSRGTGRIIRESLDKLSVSTAQQRASFVAKMGQYLLQINSAGTQSEVDKVTEWAKSDIAIIQQLPQIHNYDFASTLLKEWVLEHAGDEEDSATGTSEAQWEAARRETFKQGNLDDLDNHAEIFAYQTRLHWKKAGLGGDNYFREMKTFLDSITGMSEQSERAYTNFDSKQYVFNNPEDHDRVIKFLQANLLPIKAAFAQQALPRGEYQVICTLDLTTSDGSCYVDEWEYRFIGKNATEPYASFTISPDFKLLS